ncbi:ArsR family transcriptional regulator [Rhodobacterales bacterium HKCCE2091]|nr:ArsR family transcriptional regulator [Rhodobacterales bacterium HKCCE2091]
MTTRPDPALPPAFAAALAEPPRAPAFIVTIYGDVVEPRGGMLWMGTLIECCARHGLSETLVRTAVSRLVGAGRLEGVRIGRRSHYRLSDAAQAEFGEASRILFAPPPAPVDWLIHMGDEPLSGDWVRVASGVALAPNRVDLRRPAGLVLRAEPEAGLGLGALAAQRWPLAEVAAAYRAFLDAFAPVEAALADAAVGPDLALALRLRLVHDYRLAALADPRLPASALPPDWPAAPARRLFLGCYLSLSGPADRHVASQFRSPEGLLPGATDATRRRLALLETEVAGNIT